MFCLHTNGEHLSECLSQCPGCARIDWFAVSGSISDREHARQTFHDGGHDRLGVYNDAYRLMYGILRTDAPATVDRAVIRRCATQYAETVVRDRLPLAA